MRKEIIVNADELESRVAILEDGRLAELTVERELRIVGSIFKAKVVSVLRGMDAAFADVGLEKNVFLSADDVVYVTRSGVAAAAPRSASISERLKPNQEVVVQIVRAPVGSKGARATTRLALPGRYLVLLLFDGRQVGVSRKIEERKERERLRKIGEGIRPTGMGMIMRTEAEGLGRKELEADLKVLLDLRDRIQKKAEDAKAPALLHQDLTLTYQVIRDVFTDDVQSLLIDSKSVYDNAVELVRAIAPKLRRRVKPYRDKTPVFEKYDLESEIDRLLRRRVWLKAGGYISIDQAEAFTAIDVNTGRFTGTTGLADTILRTNLEAAEEIARQLRLRDLGGIIVIDFIDMEGVRHRQRLMRFFEDQLKRDRQKTKIVHLSPLGLIEMTRKRRGESLMGVLTEACPHCAGLGRVRNSLTVALKIDREVRRLAADGNAQAMLVRAAPRVAAVLIGDEGRRAAALEDLAAAPVYIRADERLSGEDQDVKATTTARLPQQLKLYHKGDEVVVDHVDARETPAGEGVNCWSEGYRLQVDGAGPDLESQTLVLIEAGHSFGRARPKGQAPPEEEAEKTPPRPARRRPRGRRKRAPSEAVAAPPAPAAEPEQPPRKEAPAEKQPRQRPPSRRRGPRRKKRPQQEAKEPEPKPQQAPPPAAPAPPPPEPASAATRRAGLLRRGSRLIVRPRR